MAWIGNGPAPNFQSIEFWRDTIASLEEKIKNIKTVQPHFTPEDLQKLALLESDPNHTYKYAREDCRNRAETKKRLIYASLFRLAKLGRPGQWVLHHEDFYHPSIDTRPQTRDPSREVCLGLSLRTYALPDEYKFIWAGKGPPPDPFDIDFWEEKRCTLLNKVIQAEKGLVQPRFSPEELRVLEELEEDPCHVFNECTWESKDCPPPEPTAEEKAAAERLEKAKRNVLDKLTKLRHGGVSGWWVIHRTDVYLRYFDTHLHEKNKSQEDTPQFLYNGKYWSAVPGMERFLAYCGFDPSPDLTSFEFWESTLAEIESKEARIASGDIVPSLTENEMWMMELLLLNHELLYIPGAEDSSFMSRICDVKDWQDGLSACGAELYGQLGPPPSPLTSPVAWPKSPPSSVSPSCSGGIVLASTCVTQSKKRKAPEDCGMDQHRVYRMARVGEDTKAQRQRLPGYRVRRSARIAALPKKTYPR